MSRTEPDEEVLPGGPGLPSWLAWLAGAVVVALLVGVLVDKMSASGPSASPTSTAGPSRSGSSDVPPPVAPDSRQPVGPVPIAVATGPSLRLLDRFDPLDVAVIGDQAWLLQAGRLSTFTTDADYTTRVIRHVDFVRDAPRTRLLVDAALHRVWVVVLGAAGSTIQAFDSETLVLYSAHRWEPAISGAAPLAAVVGPEAEIVAAGSDDLLIGSGDDTDALRCMSGADGRQVQFWPLAPRAAASTKRTAYVVVGSDLVPLELHGDCTG